MADRKEVKELLQRASVEIANTLQRADDMSDEELEEVAGGLASPAIRAFFDKNGHCAGLQQPGLDVSLGELGTAQLPGQTLIKK